MDGIVFDVFLQCNDVFYIFSIYDLEDVGSVMVYGEVVCLGEFVFVDNMILEDIIIQVGGLMELVFIVCVDVFCCIKDSKGMEVVFIIG